jgi:hypothetical protein
MLGNIVVQVGSEQRSFRPLTVRELCTAHNALAESVARAAILDCRALGLDADETLRRAKEAREDARLSSSIIRSCFTMDGASRIVEASTGAEAFESAVDGMTPDAISELALQLVGFEWSADLSKWVRRSREANNANGANVHANG